MEAIGVSFGAMLVIAGIMAYYGVFGLVGKVAEKATKAVEIGADMGIREVEKLADEQINRHDDWYITNKVDTARVIDANTSRAYYRAIRDGKVPVTKTEEAKA